MISDQSGNLLFCHSKVIQNDFVRNKKLCGKCICFNLFFAVEQQSFIADKVAVFFSVKYRMSQFVSHDEPSIVFIEVIVKEDIAVIFQKHIAAGTFSEIPGLNKDIKAICYIERIIGASLLHIVSDNFFYVFLQFVTPTLCFCLGCTFLC